MTRVIRSEEPAEELGGMHAHCGRCNYCTGVVKMERSEVDGKLLPERCFCFGCGQRYFMKIEEEDLTAWEIEQWDQKARMRI